MTPNKDQILSAIRTLLATGLGYAAGNGWIGTDTAATLLTLAMALIPMLWGMIDKTKANIVAKAADIVPIPVESQMKVGIDPNNAQVTPTNPKKL